MASNLTHVKFCEIQASDCDGWDCGICQQIFDAIKLAEALKPSHNSAMDAICECCDPATVDISKLVAVGCHYCSGCGRKLHQ